MNEFKKYEEITRVDDGLLGRFISSELYDPQQEWIVLEKVHGSNFSFTQHENGNLMFAKRTSFLGYDSDFFNYQSIVKKYGQNINLMIDNIKTKYPNNYITVFGELCGGYYPNMPLVLNAKRVQKEIFYSNQNEFIVYDIRLINQNNITYLDYNEVIELCNKYNVPVIPIIYRGTLNECLNWSAQNNADPSEIWKIFGMPEEVEGNIREGHVIKPLNKTIFMGYNRVIFKDKNDKFKENRRRDIKIDKNKLDVYNYPPEILDLLNEIDSMINFNRFNSVISKFGDYSIRDYATLLNLMYNDIIKDLDNHYAELLNDEITKTIKRKISTFFNQNKRELFFDK